MATPLLRALPVTLALVAACAALPRNAQAYCLARTCQAVEAGCTIDEHGCAIEGETLAWDTDTVDFVVDAGGSALRGVSGSELETALFTALNAWTQVRCPSGGRPAIAVGVLVQQDDPEVGYVEGGVNQNVVRAYDEAWPYASDVLGRAILSFGVNSGRMQDVDILLNTQQFSLQSTPEGTTDIDLVAVLTHEIGHLLGLDHSDVPGATMQPEVPGFATADLRSLEADDVDAICAAYPPGLAQQALYASPPPAFDCAIGPGRRAGSPLWLCGLALVLWLRRRAQAAKLGGRSRA